MRVNFSKEDFNVAIATSVVLYGFDGNDLKILIAEKAGEPFAGAHILPSSVVHVNEDPEDVAIELMRRITGSADWPIEILNAFAENADKIGVSNPMDKVENIIDNLAEQMSDISLDMPEFPMFENPFVTQTQNNPVTGPNTLNLPGIDQNIMSQSQAANQYSNLTMGQKIRLLFPNG